MGGRGTLDEPGSASLINRLENASRIQEVIGGHRNIQMMIINAGLRGTAIMAGIESNVQRSKKAEKELQGKVLNATVDRAKKLLEEDKELIPKEAAELEMVLNKLKEAQASKNITEILGYSKTLPRALSAASKAAYKAKKNK